MISSMPKWVGNIFSNVLRPNMKVLSVQQLSPQLKRLRFEGDISKMSFEIGYASVIRVTETDYRNYTIAYHNKEEGIVDIIFHIHGNGPGSAFAARLKTGDELFISIPRGKKFYEPKTKRQFLFGDETTLGLMHSFLPVLEKAGHEFQIYLELDEKNKDVPAILGLTNYAVLLKNRSLTSEKRISELPVFQTTDWQEATFVVGGNVHSVQAFRKVLRNYNPSKILSQGYWLEGKKGL